MAFLIEVKNLKKYFPLKTFFLSRARHFVRAVDDISFNIMEGETFGLVGESGCGKTTTGRLLLRLIEPTSGAVYFRGRNIYELNTKELRQLRREMQMIFQDPYASLNPRKTVMQTLSQPFQIHKNSLLQR